MRNTALLEGAVRSGSKLIPTQPDAQGSSFPAPIGGWDTFSPIADMPPQNAVELINFFPQPGWVELRRGYVKSVDTTTNATVETVMGYQGPTVTSPRLFAASNGKIWDVTSSPASASVSGMTVNRWQYTNFATTGGHYLWICNAADAPRFYDGSSWTVATITGITASDMTSVVVYRGRLWAILKDTTKAAYLPLDSVQGAATTFDLGAYFTNGGKLQQIGVWSTSVQGGTDEYICFISEWGECAIFLIYDPTSASGVNYVGTAQLGRPIGNRCTERSGSDLLLITVDGVFPLSQIINYDRAKLQEASISRNIRSAFADAAREFGDNFGWQILSYPRSTMLIVNVPIVEGAQQQQYVMNTITGAWCKFKGQNANCWELWQDRAYFGGNDGFVYLADEAAGDEDANLEADIQGAYNYFDIRGQNKRFSTLRPIISKDTTYNVQVSVGLSIDFQLNDSLDDLLTSNTQVAIWNDPNTIWDDPNTIWPGIQTTLLWQAVSGIGYAAAIRMTLFIPWSDSLVSAQSFKVNSFDVLFDVGGFI